MKLLQLAIAAVALGAALVGCAGDGSQHDANIPTFFASEINNGVIYVAGSKGVMLTSNDGGLNWTLRNSGTVHTLYKLGDPDTVNAFGEEGTVITTNDGGATWTEIFGHDLSDIYGADYSSGFPVTVGADGVIQAFDPGEGWITQPSGTTEDLRSIADDADGAYLAVGDNGVILDSFDGGAWEPLSSGTTEDLNGVEFANGVFFVVGDNGKILRLTKGFETVTSNTTANLRSIAAGPGVTGLHRGNTPGFSSIVAVGDGGTIVASFDGGVTWSVQSSGTTEDLLTVTGDFSDGFVAAGTHGTVLTSNDGQTWVQRLPQQTN